VNGSGCPRPYAAVEPDVRTFPGSVELTLRAASNSSLGGVPSPYPGDVSVGITQFGEKIVVRFQHSAGSVKTFPLHKPERLVVDFLAQGAKEEPVLPLPVSVEPESRAIPVEPPPVSLPPSVFPGKKPDGKPFLIAVDAGHGGHDPGAVAGGFREKDLNLKAAKRLVELLKEAGLEGRLTRRDDTYLRLNERTELANRWNADLFVSLHCNALPRGRHARGVEIYLMALPTDKDAMQLALFENRELGRNNKVQDADAKTNLLLKILGDMEQNAKSGRARAWPKPFRWAGRLPMSRSSRRFLCPSGASDAAVLVEMATESLKTGGPMTPLS